MAGVRLHDPFGQRETKTTPFDVGCLLRIAAKEPLKDSR
jgi:hypothetical protein